MSSPNNGKFVVTLPNGEDYTFWEPFPKQLQFHESATINLLMRGSRGSGKSMALRVDAHMRAMSVPGCNLVLVRRTLKELEKNHLIDIRQEMRLLGGDYHGTNYVASYPNGSRLFFSYVGDESDTLNLLGAEFLAAYFDELSTIPWDHFMKLASSVRVAGKFKGLGLKAVIRAGTNPFGESAEEVEKYFVRKDVDPLEDPDYDPSEWGYIQINMEDNPYADVEQYRKRFAGLAPHLRKAWLEGEYADEAALFDFRKTKDDKPYHVIHELNLKEIVKHARIYRAFDWGWSPDPSYCLWIAHMGNRYIAIHEIIRYKTPAPDLALEIKEIDTRLGITSVVTTLCDPTLDVHTGDVKTTKDLFEANGIPMECSINKREMFADAIHHALSQEAGPGIPKLQIYSKGCPQLIKSLPLMRANPKRPDALADHKYDHPTVALAYFLISHNSDETRPYSHRGVPKWMRPKKVSQFVLGTESVRNYNH